MSGLMGKDTFERKRTLETIKKLIDYMIEEEDEMQKPLYLKYNQMRMEQQVNEWLLTRQTA